MLHNSKLIEGMLRFLSTTLNHIKTCISSHASGKLVCFGWVRYLKPHRLEVSHAQNSCHHLIYNKYCDIHTVSSLQILVTCRVYLNRDCVELKFVDGILCCCHCLHHLSLLLPEFLLWTQEQDRIQHRNHHHAVRLKICHILTDGK